MEFLARRFVSYTHRFGLDPPAVRAVSPALLWGGLVRLLINLQFQAISALAENHTIDIKMAGALVRLARENPAFRQPSNA